MLCGDFADTFKSKAVYAIGSNIGIAEDQKRYLIPRPNVRLAFKP
jgi:hypothetical protein